MSATIEHSPEQDAHNSKVLQINVLQDQLVAVLNESKQPGDILLLALAATCASFSSQLPNPYRAVLAIVEGATNLLNSQPEVQEREIIVHAHMAARAAEKAQTEGEGNG